jgi:hypothetical protein
MDLAAGGMAACRDPVQHPWLRLSRLVAPALPNRPPALITQRSSERVAAQPVAEVVILPGLAGCGLAGGDGVAVDEDFAGADIAFEVARVLVGLSQRGGCDLRVLLGGVSGSRARARPAARTGSSVPWRCRGFVTPAQVRADATGEGGRHPDARNPRSPRRGAGESHGGRAALWGSPAPASYGTAGCSLANSALNWRASAFRLSLDPLTPPLRSARRDTGFPAEASLRATKDA